MTLSQEIASADLKSAAQVKYLTTMSASANANQISALKGSTGANSFAHASVWNLQEDVAKISDGTTNTANAFALSLRVNPVLQTFTGITSVASVSVLLLLRTPKFLQEWSGTPGPAHSFAPTKSVLQANTLKLRQMAATATASLRSVTRITIGIQKLAAATVRPSPVLPITTGMLVLAAVSA